MSLRRSSDEIVSKGSEILARQGRRLRESKETIGEVTYQQKGPVLFRLSYG